MSRDLSRTARAALVAVALAGASSCRSDLDATDPERRALAIRALGKRSGEESTPPALFLALRHPSPVVRTAAADAFAARGGPASAGALAGLLRDPSPEVAVTAARGLASLEGEPGAASLLAAGYAFATPGGRAAIADALESIGVSLREAVEAEARTLWERNVAALERGAGAAREGAAEEVGASGRQEAVQRLVGLLESSRERDPRLAAAAARGLGEAGDRSARAPLESLLSSPDPGLAAAAAAALGRLGDPSAADALAGAALSDPGRLSGVAVEALSVLPDAPEVGVALCEIALRSGEPAVAQRAARDARRREADCPLRPALARLGRPGSQAALEALAGLGLSGDAARSVGERVVPLLDARRTGDADLRRAAALALGALGDASSAPAVLRRLEELAARVDASRTRWIGDARTSTPEWIDTVSPEDARELGALLAAAGKLRAEGAESVLAARARDPNPEVRAGALAGLSGLGSPAAVELVAGALEDPDPGVRAAAAAGLGRLGARGAPHLSRAARAARPDEVDWRIALARAIGETGSAEAIPALEPLLEGSAAAAVAEAIVRIGAPAGAPMLARHLNRPGAPGRAEAIEALSQLAARDSAGAIAALLTDDRPDVREAAARVLGKLRHEPASARLEALRSDYHGRVRKAAVEALSRLPAGVPRSRR